MARRSLVIISVIVAVLVAAGVAALTWWLLKDGKESVTVIELEGDNYGQLPYKAAFINIPKLGEIFWWFYPTTASEPNNKPILLWLDGVIGVSPSLLANIGMFGPYDINMNKREDSWVKDFNLLFVDTPGTGFSSIATPLPKEITLEQNSEYLRHSLEAFYSLYENFKETPLYIVGQGHGAQLAVSFAKHLQEVNYEANLKGVIIGNGIIAPAQVLTELGNYLEQWGYIDDSGRPAIEGLSKDCNELILEGRYDESFVRFLDIGKVINEEAGALAINLGNIVEKLTEDIDAKDNYFYKTELRYAFPGVDATAYMNNVVAPALGISSPAYDSQREDALGLFKNSFMQSAVNTVEYLLQNTNLTITMYNGNLDAVSNTPGQLLWVNNLQWNGQSEFLSSPRNTFVQSSVIEGYYRQTDRLAFYWINAAGLLIAFDELFRLQIFEIRLFEIVIAGDKSKPKFIVLVKKIIAADVTNVLTTFFQTPIDSPKVIHRVIERATLN